MLGARPDPQRNQDRWFIMRTIIMDAGIRNIGSITKKSMDPGEHIYCECLAWGVVRQMVTQLTGSGMVLNHMYAGIAR